jgi:Tfp pilus assembly protein PilV
VTLSEVLMAVAIIAVGLLALLGAIPVASYAIQEGNQLSTGAFLANQRLEEVKNAQWTASPAVDALGISASSSSAPQSAGTTTFPDEAPMAAPYATYTRVVRVTDCGVAGCVGITNVRLRQVTVTVSYYPMTGAGQVAAIAKSVVASTLVTQR